MAVGDPVCCPIYPVGVAVGVAIDAIGVAVDTVGVAIDTVDMAVGVDTVRLRAYTPLDFEQRWRDAGGFLLCRKQIVDDVFDKDSLSLR